MEQILGYLLAIFGLALVLIKAASMVVFQLEYITKKTGINSYGMAAILAAISTSLPELVVAITSALEGTNQLALGNVMGANIANISITLGLAAIISGAVVARDKFIKHELMIAFLIALLPMLLLVDGTLSRTDAVLLCLAYGLYAIKELFKPAPKKSNLKKIQHQDWRHQLHRWANARTERHLMIFLSSVGIMIVVADLMVKLAVSMAGLMEIPIFLVGLIIVSIGTTLPEVAFGIQAIKHHRADMAFGNLAGSLVVNASLILGLSALIAPITVDVKSLWPFFLSAIGLIFIFGLFWKFTSTKHKLESWEGGVLVLTYIAFGLIQYFYR